VLPHLDYRPRAFAAWAAVAQVLMGIFMTGESVGNRGRICKFTSIVAGVLALLPAAAIAGTVDHSADGGQRTSAQPLTCQGKRVTIRGTAGPDHVAGTTGPDVIAGLGGNDLIRGLGGNDVICGGPGNDRIFGGAGDDRLAGGKGNDRIWGGPGRDLLSGGPGADHLHGGGQDTCKGGRGKNRLTDCQTEDLVSAQNFAVTTNEGQSQTIDLLGGGHDTAGHPLSVVAVGTPDGGSTTTIVGTQGGQVRFDPARGYESLGANQSAVNHFTYELGDGHGKRATGSVTVTIEGVDNPPISVGDKAHTSEGEAVSIDVGGNDQDVDGGPKEVASLTQPAHGVVSIENGTRVLYQPDAGYCNDREPPDSFGYKLTGGSSATVEVAVSCSTRIAVQPALFPAFNPEVFDYVVRCDGSPVSMTGVVAEGESISIDHGTARTGRLGETKVPLEANQEFEFSLDGATSHTYYVRCLPADFPAWEYEQTGRPSHAFYAVTPTSAFGPGASRYGIIFDRNGAPVWWDTDSPKSPVNLTVLQDGNVAWFGSSNGSDAYEVRSLDGTLLREVRPEGGPTDVHEFQQEPNGNQLLISFHMEEHVDLTAFGGGADETVKNAEVQEISPTGEDVWHWSTEGHIALAETGRWWPAVLTGKEGDIVHMNAVQPDGENAILVSLRHTDAIYKIDKGTGEIIWKLGGTPTTKSLTVVNDPEGSYPFGGQHDVRLLPDGTVSVHDNNTNLAWPPRAVRYRIDEAAMTATLVEELQDPEVTESACCGSARRSPDGSWLMSWGGNSLVTEFNAAQQRVFRLGFGGIAFSYRAMAAPEGALTAEALRTGMDAMFPRP
jgi:hypothetical protein